MELRHLRYIVAVAEELHFGRAAIRLNISQPPLSLQIRKTEEEFGFKIFNRTKREVRLTEAGKRIVAEAYQVLDQVDRFERVVSQASEGEIGHLSVGALNGVSEILVNTLALFGKRYPGIHIDLEYMCTGDQIQGLREGKIQVGFLVLPNQDGVFVGEAIKKAPLTLALPESHPLARCRSVPVTALRDQSFIFFHRRATPALHDMVTGLCRDAGFTLNVVHEVDSITASLTLVRANLGLAFCVAGVETKSKGVVFRPLQDPQPCIQYSMVYKRDSQSPALDSFMNVVREVVRKGR